MTHAATRRVHPGNLGAWLIKGNADRTDLRTRFARDPHVTRWCVQPSYRLELMGAGQPVLFWASGSRRHDITYGIWGWGHLTGPPQHDSDDAGWAHVTTDQLSALDDQARWRAGCSRQRCRNSQRTCFALNCMRGVA